MTTINGGDVRKLVIACDAGMGSSVMLAGQLRRKLKKQQVEVAHATVDAIPADADVVLTHTGLADRARRAASGTPVVTFEVYIGDPAVDGVVAAIISGAPITTGGGPVG